MNVCMIWWVKKKDHNLTDEDAFAAAFMLERIKKIKTVWLFCWIAMREK